MLCTGCGEETSRPNSVTAARSDMYCSTLPQMTKNLEIGGSLKSKIEPKIERVNHVHSQPTLEQGSETSSLPNPTSFSQECARRQVSSNVCGEEPDALSAMSSAPQHGRPKQSQSPPHHKSQMMSGRPPARSAPYPPPRFYRPPNAAPGPSPRLGWTPRTAASPHTPVAHKPHSRPPGPPHSHHDVSLSHSAPSESPSSLSPRVNLPGPNISKPIAKPAVSPVPAPAVVPAHTPSWLMGNYKPQAPKPSSTEPITMEEWCEKRLEDIQKTVNGGNEVKEFRDVLDKLDSDKIVEEIALTSSIRNEYWRCLERKRKAENDLSRAERESQRLRHVGEHVSCKINRLRGYARFIESGWVDEELLGQKPIQKREDKPKKENDIGHKKEENKIVIQTKIEPKELVSK